MDPLKELTKLVGSEDAARLLLRETAKLPKREPPVYCERLHCEGRAPGLEYCVSTRCPY